MSSLSSPTLRLTLVALGATAGLMAPRSLLAQGSLTPPGAPAPTMKSLDQIEPRTAISAPNFVIANPGAYYLTGNLVVPAGPGITIAASGVTLDLNGFALLYSGADTANTNAAIQVNRDQRNIAIYNGAIQGGVTNDLNNFFVGSGFGYGIAVPQPLNDGSPQASPVNIRVSDINLSGLVYDGINLPNSGSLVERCTVNIVGGSGIQADSVRGCSATGTGRDAIKANEISDSRGDAQAGYGIYGQTVQNSYGTTLKGNYGTYGDQVINSYGEASHQYGYGVSGFTVTASYGIGSVQGVFAFTAQNSYGSSDAGTGLQAYNVENCNGETSTGIGLQAETATGCSGDAYMGTFGLIAHAAINCNATSHGPGTAMNCVSAMNCYAQSYAAGVGLAASIANNSYGTSVSGTGIIATNIAMTCVGASTSGTGLQTRIANSSVGTSASGLPVSAVYKYNMP